MFVEHGKSKKIASLVSQNLNLNVVCNGLYHGESTTNSNINGNTGTETNKAGFSS